MKFGAKREREREREDEDDSNKESKSYNSLLGLIGILNTTSIKADVSGNFLNILSRAEYDESIADRNLLELLQTLDNETIKTLDWNRQDGDGFSSLSWIANAAANERPECLRELIERLDTEALQSLDWNQTNYCGNSPLTYISSAAESGFPELLMKLFDKLNNETFQNLKWNCVDLDTNDTPLHWLAQAAKKGHPKPMRSLLMRLDPAKVKKLNFNVESDEQGYLVDTLHDSNYKGWIAFAIMSGCKISKKPLSQQAKDFVKNIKAEYKKVRDIADRVLSATSDDSDATRIRKFHKYLKIKEMVRCLLENNDVKSSMVEGNDPNILNAVKYALLKASENKYSSEEELAQVKILAQIAFLLGDTDAFFVLGSIYEIHQLWDSASNAYARVPQESSKFEAAQAQCQKVSSIAADYFHGKTLNETDTDMQELYSKRALKYALRCSDQYRKTIMELILGTRLTGGRTIGKDIEKVRSVILEIGESGNMGEELFERIAFHPIVNQYEEQKRERENPEQVIQSDSDSPLKKKRGENLG